VELADARRAAAERLGFPTLDAGDGLPRRVRGRVGGGGAEVVVESTGVAAVAAVAVECATRGGRISVVGLPKVSSELDLRRLTLFERSLVGSLGYRHDLPRVLSLVASGALDPAAIVGDTVALADAPATIAALASATDERIKVLVDARE
jgi:(R,R)-butanediol dehydrogenase/meso-butanediol dehydrogenase/diacetyl reductase